MRRGGLAVTEQVDDRLRRRPGADRAEVRAVEDDVPLATGEHQSGDRRLERLFALTFSGVISAYAK